MRAIKKIHGDKPSYWVGNGFRVQTLLNHLQPQPDFNYEHTDPFLLLDYGVPRTFAPNPNYETEPRGIGQHPHKGFETVTIAYAGEISHKDSTGASGIIHEGDVQWMTAGRGIMHEEFHSPDFGARGGLFSMVQLWINLPQQHKLTEANYQPLKRTVMPKVQLFNAEKNDSNKPTPIGSATIIAGDFQDTKGLATTFTPINMWDIELHAAGTVNLPIPSTHTLMIMVQEGELLINDTLVSAGKLVQFDMPATDASLLGKKDIITLIYPERSHSVKDTPSAKLLVLSGEPIGEPIAAHGPFVMTTQEELKQTFHDYQNGKFVQ